VLTKPTKSKLPASIWSGAARLPPPRTVPPRAKMVRLSSLPRTVLKPPRPLASVTTLRSVFSRRKPL
jgi:hypothetical protein